MPNIPSEVFGSSQCLTRAQLGLSRRGAPGKGSGQLELGRLVPRADSIELRRLADALDWAGRPGGPAGGGRR